jgi:hypothetical protein
LIVVVVVVVAAAAAAAAVYNNYDNSDHDELKKLLDSYSHEPETGHLLARRRWSQKCIACCLLAIILPSTSRSPKWALPLRFSDQSLYAYLIFPMHRMFVTLLGYENVMALGTTTPATAYAGLNPDNFNHCNKVKGGRL